MLKPLQMLLVGMTSGMIETDVLVSGVQMDSRAVQTGDLFIALAADDTIRTQHIHMAIAAGAAALVVDKETTVTATIPVIIARNLNQRVSEIAARFYGHPSMALTIVAVTGTNGKTSVSQFVAQALQQQEVDVAVMGSLGIGRLGACKLTGMTTPDPITIQRELAALAHDGVTHLILEASSHALVQGRLNSVDVDCAVFTNLSRDHLDYHATMADYAAAKAQLFKFPSVQHAIINMGDAAGRDIAAALPDALVPMGYAQHADSAMIRATDVVLNNKGLRFTVVTPWGERVVQSQLLGQFNVDNLMASLAVLMALGVSFDDSIKALASCQSAEGRMQAYGGDKKPLVVVDFAHTPDALQQALTSLRTHKASNGQLWCVFGCGGDRDIGKRAEMGAIAEVTADKVVVTSDNPRSEAPETIMQAIVDGMTAQNNAVIEGNRRHAIQHAVAQAGSDDIVLVAGKGHESYQEVMGVKYHFSDAEVVSEALAQRVAA